MVWFTRPGRTGADAAFRRWPSLMPKAMYGSKSAGRAWKTTPASRHGSAPACGADWAAIRSCSRSGRSASAPFGSRSRRGPTMLQRTYSACSSPAQPVDPSIWIARGLSRPAPCSAGSAGARRALPNERTPAVRMRVDPFPLIPGSSAVRRARAERNVRRRLARDAAAGPVDPMHRYADRFAAACRGMPAPSTGAVDSFTFELMVDREQGRLAGRAARERRL